MSLLTSSARFQSNSLIVLVLLGRKNSGKSSVGNTVLGTRDFEAGQKTTASVKHFGWVDGVRVAIVDTPGWSLYGLTDAKRVKEEILRGVTLCPTGDQIFLLVIPVDTFSKKDQQAVEEHLSILGHHVWRHTMVLFTWGDKLRGKSIEKHIKKNGKFLHEILEKCGYRYHIFNNKTADCSQVSQLLQTIKNMTVTANMRWT